MIADLTAITGNLPAEPNSFIGRERDLAELAEMFAWVRLLTLCGPGGIGKTRLAVRLAAELLPAYPDGAWLVDLDNAQDAVSNPVLGAGDDGDVADGMFDHLVPLVTATLGIRRERDRPLVDTLIEALRPRQMLLILDTCERIVADCASLAQRLLAQCPGLRVIATSREPLRVRGEVIWRVPPLSLPAANNSDTQSPADVANSDAVRLFVARAMAVRPGFVLDEANLPAVLGVCRTLDGVPLAIELAAARARALSAEQISHRLGNRFDLLASGDRTAPRRQQTLRATVEWSFGLLTDDERLLLRRLSVFRGWSLEMAERVCADETIPASGILDLLTALIDKSLVHLEPELNGGSRYRLLDTVRELTAEQSLPAVEVAALRAAHRDCMLDIAEQIACQAFVKGEPSWPARVAMYHRARADRANFNQALAYCVETGDVEHGLRLCYAHSSSWIASGELADGAAWLDRLLVIPGWVRPAVRARVHRMRAELAFELHDPHTAQAHARACLALAEAEDDSNAAASGAVASSAASARRLLALLALQSGDAATAMQEVDAAIAGAIAAADDWEEGIARAAKATIIASQGDLAGAQRVYEEALDVLRGNNGWGVALVLYGLGRLATSRNEPATAVKLFDEALGIYRQLDATPEMARCLAVMGQVALSQQDLTSARLNLTESMRLGLLSGQRLPIARGLAALAALAAACSDTASAVRLASAARTAFDALGERSSGSYRRLDAILDAARTQLGTTAVDALIAEGSALSPHQAALLADLPSPSIRQSAEQRAGPLTERENEITLLLAQGLSNKEIGERLFITQATVARHVANIFTKLGLSSRAQVAAWVANR